MLRRPRPLVLAALGLLICPELARAKGESAAGLRRAREALAANHAARPLEITGRTHHAGLPATFALRLGEDGRFRLAIEGRLSRTTGYDGADAWRRDDGSPAYPLVLLHRERALATVWVWSGEWACEDSPFELRALDGPEGKTRVELELKGGLLHAELTLSDETGLPETLAFPATFGGGELRFGDWRSSDRGTHPWSITWIEPFAPPMVYETRAVQAVDGTESEDFAAPGGGGTDTIFDVEARPELELRRTERGHLFVRPRINGREVGWFLFDSGAGATVIAESVADELGLEAFGEVAMGGFGGPPTPRPLRQSATLQLGPLTVRGLAMHETPDMGMADAMLGEPCAGALGWDVFLRAVVEVDPQVPSVALHDPATYASADGHWEDIALHWKVPYVRARFEGDREGLFCIDTGAGLTGVLFHSLATRELKLLDGREGERMSGRGAGGSFEMREVELAWFEVAGHRVEPARALLSVSEDDGEADPYALGFLGSGFLEPYRLVFDYSRRRLGFQAR